MKPETLLKLQAYFLRMKQIFERARNVFLKFTEYDYQWIIIILVLATLLRLPFLAHPNRTEFDEVIYTNFSLHILQNEPFFDIHPPLVRSLFSEIARNNGPITIGSIPMETGQAFGDFPYIALRRFVACMGILLPLLIFAIGRLLHYRPRIAALPALFIVFDSALIIYARTTLPDTLLLVFNFLAFGSAYAILRTPDKRLSVFLVALMGIAAGLALSIKWTALGVIGTIGLLFLFERRFREIFIAAFIAVLVYITIFAAFFSYFPQGGRVDFMLFAFDTPWIREIDFPKPTALKDVLKFLPEHHETMLRANNDQEISKVVLQAPGPIAWATARSSIDFWRGENGKKITFQGNALLWTLCFFIVLFEAGWILWNLKTTRRWPIDRDETILFVGYLINYLPFFLIHRPMYLYHYFTALIFLFLLVPKVAPRLIHCIGTLTKDRLFAKVLAAFTLFLVLLNFILLIPVTYGL